jgi:hypothetical protein
MRHDNGPGIHMTDEYINEIVQGLQQRQEMHQSLAYAPDLRLTYDLRRAYQDETDQDRHSLERVFLGLVGNQATARPKINSLPKIDQQQERISVMQKNAIQPFSQRKTGWERRLNVFAAILCTMLLVGGFLTIFNAARVNHTTSVGSQIEVTPTPQPTDSPASHAIPKAVLTDSPTGNSEGIGPGLSGITATNQFTVGQQFWIFFLVNDDSGGTIAVKWYANSRLYSSTSRYLPATSRGEPSPAPTPSRNSPASTASPVESNFSTTYDQPAAGKVELYWKGQLAMTLFFVVKPKA